MLSLKLLNNLCGTTIGELIFKEVEKTLIQYNLKWDLLRCVSTDGGKNMCTAEKDVVGQIHKGSEKMRYLKAVIITRYFAEKNYNLSRVIEPESSTANFICSHGLITNSMNFGRE